MHDRPLENGVSAALTTQSDDWANGVDSEARRAIVLLQGSRQTVRSGGDAAAEVLARTSKFKCIRRRFLPCFCAASFSGHAGQA
jgi:hypothetical protein